MTPFDPANLDQQVPAIHSTNAELDSKFLAWAERMDALARRTKALENAQMTGSTEVVFINDEGLPAEGDALFSGGVRRLNL